MKSKMNEMHGIPRNMEIMFLLFSALKPYFERLNEIEEKISEMNQKLDVILENISSPVEESEIIVTREISYKNAKRMVLDYFKKHKEADIEELHKNLKIEIETLIRILQELEEEGSIG